jgi:hypothetical protein
MDDRRQTGHRATDASHALRRTAARNLRLRSSPARKRRSNPDSRRFPERAAHRFVSPDEQVSLAGLSLEPVVNQAVDVIATCALVRSPTAS